MFCYLWDGEIVAIPDFLEGDTSLYETYWPFLRVGEIEDVLPFGFFAHERSEGGLL